MNTVNIKTIYLDMDGVLSNFNSKWQELFNEHPTSSRNKSNWKKFISENCFSKLDPMPDYRLLLDYVDTLSVNVEILTSSGGETYHEEVKEQKRIWLKKHNINYHLNVVPGKRFKSSFASPSRLLIDDTLSVVLSFTEAGGYAIQHSLAKDTIKMVNGFFIDYAYQ